MFCQIYEIVAFISPGTRSLVHSTRAGIERNFSPRRFSNSAVARVTFRTAALLGLYQ